MGSLNSFPHAYGRPQKARANRVSALCTGASKLSGNSAWAESSINELQASCALRIPLSPISPLPPCMPRQRLPLHTIRHISSSTLLGSSSHVQHLVEVDARWLDTRDDHYPSNRNARPEDHHRHPPRAPHSTTATPPVPPADASPLATEGTVTPTATAGRGEGTEERGEGGGRRGACKRRRSSSNTCSIYNRDGRGAGSRGTAVNGGSSSGSGGGSNKGNVGWVCVSALSDVSSRGGIIEREEGVEGHRACRRERACQGGGGCRLITYEGEGVPQTGPRTKCRGRGGAFPAGSSLTFLNLKLEKEVVG